MTRLLQLGVGGVLAMLATGSWSVAAAAWLAPVLLLRVTRTAPLHRGLLPAALVHGAAFALAWRGTFGIPWAGFALMGVVFFLPYAVDRLLVPRQGSVATTLVFPSALVAMEYAMATLPLLNGQPVGTWGAVAYSQVGVLPVVQLASVTGMWGITFLVGWTAALVQWAWERGFQWPAVHRGVLAGVGVLSVVLVWGGARVARAPAVEAVRAAGIAVDNPALTVGIWNPVAAGRPVTAEDRARMGARLDTLHHALLEATTREARAGARIVAWAEDNAIVFKEDEAALVARGRALAREEGIHLFMGVVALLPGEKAENKVVAIDPAGEVAFEYLKAYPTPWESSVRGDGVLRFLPSVHGPLGAAICYDFDFPALIRAAGRAGATLMMAPSDDGLQADPLHAHMASLRAVENGFTLLRPVIGGRALATDAFGRVLAQADYGPGAYFAGGTHVLVADLPVRPVATVYARVGDVLPWLCLVALALAAVVTGRRGLRRSR